MIQSKAISEPTNEEVKPAPNSFNLLMTAAGRGDKAKVKSVLSGMTASDLQTVDKVRCIVFEPLWIPWILCNFLVSIIIVGW